jgi:hypothetical protein
LKLRGVVLSREKCSCLRCLCAAGCNIDIRNSDNIRADITALKYGHNDVADLLDRLRATGQRDTLARQLVPTSKPALRLSLRLLGHSGVGKTSLVKSLGAGLFSSLFRRSSSLQSNKCKSHCWPTLSPKALSSATVVAHQHPNRDGRDLSTELSQFREQRQLPVHQRDPRTKYGHIKRRRHDRLGILRTRKLFSHLPPLLVAFPALSHVGFVQFGRPAVHSGPTGLLLAQFSFGEATCRFAFV